MLYLLVASTLPGVAAPSAGSSSGGAAARKFDSVAWDQLLAGATIPCGTGYLDSVVHTAVGTIVYDDATQQYATADAFDAAAAAYILGIEDASKRPTRGVWTGCFGDLRGTTGVAKTESASLRHTIVFETLRVLRALPEPKPLIVYETQLAKAGSAGSQTCSRTYCVTDCSPRSGLLATARPARHGTAHHSLLATVRSPSYGPHETAPALPAQCSAFARAAHWPMTFQHKEPEIPRRLDDPASR